jgi:hypothetical protein
VDAELDLFKSAINLIEYAASLGYKKVNQGSSKNSMTMRHANGDKVVITRAHDQHWTYFSVHYPSDNGSIVDFIQRRTTISLGHLRLSLRPWLGKSDALSPISQTKSPSTTKNRQRVIEAYRKTKIIDSSTYLEGRGLESLTLCHPRFHGMIREDFRSNQIAYFPIIPNCIFFYT